MVERNIDDVAISSRIRLARNIDGLVFPTMGDDRMLDIAVEIAKELNKHGKYRLLSISDMSTVDIGALKEKYLISNDLIENKENGAVILSDDETISIMINEEDHIRAQCVLNGSNLAEAYHRINKVDDIIGSRFKYAFSNELGFLTSCPTNLGTAMRASVMVFLPGLNMINRMKELIYSLNKYHITVRGGHGEGTDSEGYLFQVSNQRSLGQSEDDILNIVNSIIEGIYVKEIEARQLLAETHGDELKDKIMRSWGILTNAYKIDTSEFVERLSDVKLGVSLGYIRVRDKAVLNDLFSLVQPSNLTKYCGKNLSPRERDIYRAEFISKHLKTIADNKD